jgi:hypothetical protein
MPRITKAHKKESIIPFAHDAMKIVKENLNLNDLEKREDKPTIEYNGWYYTIHKSIANVKPEIRVKRQNYRFGHTLYFKDQIKGNRINESAWIYKEGVNCTGNFGEDIGYKIDGYSIQDYIKKAF